MNDVVNELKYKDLESLKETFDLSFDTKSDIKIMKYKYDEIINNTNSKILVIRKNDKVVASIKYDIIDELMMNGKSYMYLSNLCVHPDYRKNGYARMLMNEAYSIAKKFGCEYIFLNSSYFREESHKLYESLGYIKRDSNIFKKVII